MNICLFLYTNWKTAKKWWFRITANKHTGKGDSRKNSKPSLKILRKLIAMVKIRNDWTKKNEGKTNSF